MQKTSKIKFELPDSCYDRMVRSIRDGNSKADKDFLKDNPHFTEEAMEKRKQARNAAMKKSFKKDLLEKFGK